MGDQWIGSASKAPSNCVSSYYCFAWSSSPLDQPKGWLMDLPGQQAAAVNCRPSCWLELPTQPIYVLADEDSRLAILHAWCLTWATKRGMIKEIAQPINLLADSFPWPAPSCPGKHSCKASSHWLTVRLGQSDHWSTSSIAQPIHSANDCRLCANVCLIEIHLYYSCNDNTDGHLKPVSTVHISSGTFWE